MRLVFGHFSFSQQRRIAPAWCGTVNSGCEKSLRKSLCPLTTLDRGEVYERKPCRRSGARHSIPTGQKEKSVGRWLAS